MIFNGSMVPSVVVKVTTVPSATGPRPEEVIRSTTATTSPTCGYGGPDQVTVSDPE